MKRTRITALLMTLLLLISLVSAAPAEQAKPLATMAPNRILSQNRLVTNGENTTFLMFAWGGTFFEKDKEYTYSWQDLEFDCDGKMSASTSAKWIHVTNGKYGFKLRFDHNTKQKARTAKLTVTGKNFKATLRFRQYGLDQIVSVKRNKNKVTVKLNYATGAEEHFFRVSAYRYDEDGYSYSRTIVHKDKSTKTSYTFKVEEGWIYSISFGTAIPDGEWYWASYDDSVYFPVDSVKGSETIR